MTEMTGFFAFEKYSNVPGHKSRHEPVSTEWQSVWLISPYNVYQNTISVPPASINPCTARPRASR